MSNGDIIVSLDIGTSKVRAIIGELNNGAVNIIGVGSSDSIGIRKGAIVDIDQTVQSIRKAIDHAERMVGIQISDVYVGISGNHIALQASHGVVAVSNEDREIGDEDVERVLQAAKVIALPPEREIIGIVPKQYLVDGLDDIHDPRGMIGVRLEVEATIITGSKTPVHNLIRCVEKSDLHISGLVLTSLASSQLALSKDEKILGTVLVDIGAGATTIAIFEQDNLTFTTTLPIGGDFITNDISIGLRTEKEIAEKIKLKYGCALIDQADENTTFSANRIGNHEEKEFNQLELAHIIEPRVQEIFQLIHNEVRRLKGKEPAGGYVLTGGAVLMPGMINVAEETLNMPVRIAEPDFIGVRDASYTNGVGIILHSTNYYKWNSNNQSSTVTNQASKPAKKNVIQRVKDFFKEFI
ncbi:cell division protein FtsA [Longirhabdus pacifica]|uniref:cell division protein FtsA n=1 Tax=Longirhabdus pacifica TaxID=2305227 RepID=UPI00100913B0|nr:cell division protein FtsA [Longirhabdus pacifica]